MTEQPSSPEAARVIVEDDVTITNESVVWRRLSPMQAPADENNPGRRRLSEGGFSDSSDGSGMSVHLVVGAEDPRSYLQLVGRPHDGIAEIVVRDVRATNLYGIVRRPTPEDPEHCEITGARSSKKRRHLFKHATLILDPDPT